MGGALQRANWQRTRQSDVGEWGGVVVFVGSLYLSVLLFSVPGRHRITTRFRLSLDTLRVWYRAKACTPTGRTQQGSEKRGEEERKARKKGQKKGKKKERIEDGNLFN